MSKLFAPLFLCLLFPFLLTSQVLLPDSPAELLLEQFGGIKNPPSLSVEEVIVLDSFTNTAYNNLPGYISSKRTYDYNSEAEQTHYRQYSYDNELMDLEQTREDITTYTDNKATKVYQFLSFNSNELVNSSRDIRCFDDDDNLLSIDRELWDTYTEDWNKWQRQIVTENTDITLFLDEYVWDENLQEFVFYGKEEYYYNNPISYRSITYKLDNSGELYQDFNYEYDLLPESGYQIYALFRTYDDYEMKWDTIFASTSEVDLVTNSGYRLDGNSPSGGAFQYNDSIALEFNAEKMPAKTYSYQLNNGDPTLNFISDIEYLEDFRFSKITDYEADGTTLRRIGNWYYSSILTSGQKNTAPQLAVQLDFPNPATRQDIVTISGEGVAESFDFWITDQQGKIISRQLVNINDQIKLSDKNLSGGLYYLTLFGETGQKTWKIVVE